MIEMEDKYIEELKKKLESGDISQELFDEITKRWGDEKAEAPQEEGDSTETSGERKGTTRISGSGNLSDVTSEYLKISGSGRISGKVNVDNMSVSGSGRVEEDIFVARTLEASGSLSASKQIEAETIETSGSLKAGSIKAGTIESSGSLKVEGDIVAREMEVSGSCHAANIISDSLHSSGSLDVETVTGKEVEVSGAIRANAVECKSFSMSVDGGSHRNSIGKLNASEVKITSRRRFFKSTIEIDEITCKEGYLESVKAKKVFADEVVVGDGSVIDYVEAKVIKTSGDAVIKEKKVL